MLILLCFILLHNAINAENHITLKSYAIDNKTVSSIHTDTNILSCARKCKDGNNCTGFIYNETDKLCGLKFQSGSSDLGQEVSGTGFKVMNYVHKPCGKWKKLFSVDKNGHVTSGSFEELKKTVDSGAKLQVVAQKGKLIHSYEINTVLSNDNMVCAQSKMHLSFTSSWVSTLLCTKGLNYMLRFKMNLTGSETISEITDVRGTDWFVFDDVCHRIKLIDNTNLYETLHNKPLPSITTVQSNDIFVKINHQTFIDVIEEQVEVTSYGEVTSSCNNGEFQLDDMLTWKTTTYHFSKKSVEELVCAVNDIDPCSYSLVNQAKQTMYIEGNWEEAFIRAVSGDEAFGSFENLRTKLLQGHNLQVYFSGKYREPDILFVDDNDISAVFSSYPVTIVDSDQPSVVWYLVSTSGRYETIEIDYFTGKLMNYYVNRSKVIWFIDKAMWTPVQSLEGLFDAVKSGKPVRIKSNCNENSTMLLCLYGGIYVYYEEGKQVIARSNLIPYTTLDHTGLHLSMHDPPKWMHLITHSDNNLRKRSMLYRHQLFEEGVTEIKHGTSWYINDGIHV